MMLVEITDVTFCCRAKLKVKVINNLVLQRFTFFNLGKVEVAERLILVWQLLQGCR